MEGAAMAQNVRICCINKYLKTQADGDWPNNLLSLPECP
jgi:hypothetical protein